MMALGCKCRDVDDVTDAAVDVQQVIAKVKKAQVSSSHTGTHTHRKTDTHRHSETDTHTDTCDFDNY